MTFTLVPGAIEIQVRGFQFWLGVPVMVIFPGLFAWLERGVSDL
jgi:hypothetical protein